MGNKGTSDRLLAHYTPSNGLCSGEFLFYVYKNDSKTSGDMLFKATKYMNAKDSMITQDEKGKKKDVQDDTRPYGRRKAP